MNFLQWELELKQSYLLDNEQTWAERFDRVATENAALMVALQTRSEELRKVAIEKMSKWRKMSFAMMVPWVLMLKANSSGHEVPWNRQWISILWLTVISPEHYVVACQFALIINILVQTSISRPAGKSETLNNERWPEVCINNLRQTPGKLCLKSFFGWRHAHPAALFMRACFQAT